MLLGAVAPCIVYRELSDTILGYRLKESVRWILFACVWKWTSWKQRIHKTTLPILTPGVTVRSWELAPRGSAVLTRHMHSFTRITFSCYHASFQLFFFQLVYSCRCQMSWTCKSCLSSTISIFRICLRAQLLRLEFPCQSVTQTLCFLPDFLTAIWLGSLFFLFGMHSICTFKFTRASATFNRFQILCLRAQPQHDEENGCCTVK